MTSIAPTLVKFNISHPAYGRQLLVACDRLKCLLIDYCVVVSDVDRVERFRLTLSFFDDVSTAS